jgi:hypothetical protein
MTLLNAFTQVNLSSDTDKLLQILGKFVNFSVNNFFSCL